MRKLSTSLTYVTHQQLKLDVGALPMWRDELGVLHFDDDCRAGTQVAIDATDLQAAVSARTLCDVCDTWLATGPWAATLIAASALHHNAVSALLYPRSSLGGYPDYKLDLWVRTAGLAAAVANGRWAQHAVRAQHEHLPAAAAQELRRWLDHAVGHAESVLAEWRADLVGRYDLRRVCWRYVGASYAPPLPAGDLRDTARRVRSTWLTALNRGASPENAAVRTRAVPAPAERPAMDALVAGWQADAERLIEASLAVPWHDVALVEARKAGLNVLYNDKGRPYRRSERRHFALAYFGGRLLAEDEVLLLRTPSVIAAGLQDKIGMSADLGIEPAFPTPEHLRVALKLRTSGGAMSHLGNACAAARSVLTAPC
jgi:hypothetical protein